MAVEQEAEAWESLEPRVVPIVLGFGLGVFWLVDVVLEAAVGFPYQNLYLTCSTFFIRGS